MAYFHYIQTIMNECHNNTYFVAFDDEVFGPYSFSELLNLGVLPDTLVCTYESEWTPASQLPELQHQFNQNNSSRESAPQRRYNNQERNHRTQHTTRRTPIYDNKYLIYKQKRKAALIGILTLGLAGLSIMGVGKVWEGNIFAGTSFGSGSMKYFFKVLSFMIISTIIAIPFFIISVVRFIYYSIKISNLKNS